jgi:hypothetical protein
MKNAIVFILLLAVAAFAFAGGEDEVPAGPTSEPQAMMMEGFKSAEGAGVTVQWMVEGDMLTVVMSAPTTGWVAVGFDPSRQMADANIIIGYVEDGEVFLSDEYGIGNVRHGADVDNGGVDNLSGVEGSEADGATTLKFTIPLDSGDSTDKPLVAGNTYKIILAHGPNGADDFGTYHGSRGSVEVEL